MRFSPVVVASVLLAALPNIALAHSFGQLYTLPVPLWLYGWGAAATLIVSFVVAALFMSAPSISSTTRPRVSGSVPLNALHQRLQHTVPTLRLFGVFILLLCIATGFLGHRDPLRNFSLTFFWIIFVLLFTYLTPFIGNFYAALNPWRSLANGIGRIWHNFSRGRINYPRALADWPALLLYLGFIWFELFGSGRPKPLATFLTAYTLLNLLGVWLVGARSWFRHCEFFSVFFRLIALMAPLDYQRGEPGKAGRLSLRWPVTGLLQERPSHISTVAFALAMLSTTAFDGLKATQSYSMLFWGDPSGWLTQWHGVHPIKAIEVFMPWYVAWQTLCLLTSPFIYLGLYLLTLKLAKRLTGSQRSISQLALDFGYTLLPIAFVYHLTHYATVILNHGLKIISLASDPFGWQWNLFGTLHSFRAPILPDMAMVWHSQVGMILLGHIVSVWLAHRVALQVFGTRGKAMKSQLPMLALMIAFTIAGLWILAQPLTALRFL